MLQLFLIYCNNATAMNQKQLSQDNTAVCLLRDFRDLVDEKFQSWHKVKDYAAHLHITAKHLSKTVKDICGRSAKQLIQDRLTLEAKRLLIHTDLPVKQIAFHLGFDQPLHFSAFFKKTTMTSPTKYRAESKAD